MPTRTQQPGWDIYGFEYWLVRQRNRLFFHLYPKDTPDAEKIFALGAPKTGTTTIHRIATHNGLSGLHAAGNWRTWKAQVFSDRGNYQPFDLLSDAYPKAKFVLNTRPLNRFLRSHASHRERKRIAPSLNERQLRNVILRRNAYYLRLLRHFRDADNFFICNIESNAAIAALCDWLGFDVPETTHFHATKRQNRPDLDARVGNALNRVVQSGEEALPLLIPSLLGDEDAAFAKAVLEERCATVKL